MSFAAPAVASPDGAVASAQVEEIWRALDVLCDPEIPVVTLRELGILREVGVGADGVVEVVITPTYSGCPAMGQIEEDVRVCVQALGQRARVVTRLAPAWTTDWITPIAREKLRAYGIAPPLGACAGADMPGPGATSGQSGVVLRFLPRAISPEVACPQCGSLNTSETSRFGSTACKAQYRCLACMEPFDYFKPY